MFEPWFLPFVPVVLLGALGVSYFLAIDPLTPQASIFGIINAHAVAGCPSIHAGFGSELLLSD